MFDQILLNIKINLKFYMRNKLVIIIGAFSLVILGLTLIPTFFFVSETDKFRIIQKFFSSFSRFTGFLAFIFGLITVYYHRSNRYIKMVITKPCPPEIWLLSNFLSSFIVFFSIYLLSFTISIILFAVWNIPFQWGMLFVVFDSFINAAIIFSTFTLLTILFHPVIAIVASPLIDGSTYSFLVSIADSGIDNVENVFTVFLLKALKEIFYLLYMILPSSGLFDKSILKIHKSYVVQVGDLKYIFFSLTYSLIHIILLYFLSAYFLKKNRHI